MYWSHRKYFSLIRFVPLQLFRDEPVSTYFILATAPNSFPGKFSCDNFVNGWSQPASVIKTGNRGYDLHKSAVAMIV